jgi:hypothetical protein
MVEEHLLGERGALAEREQLQAAIQL